jgi:hypothetical protein
MSDKSFFRLEFYWKERTLLNVSECTYSQSLTKEVVEAAGRGLGKAIEGDDMPWLGACAISGNGGSGGSGGSGGAATFAWPMLSWLIADTDVGIGFAS